MSGKKYTVNLNNLIYLGINHNYAPLKNSALRYALSSALSRNEIISASHYTDAVAATGFFHPLWEETSGYQTIQSEANLKISVENLANIGYNILNGDGFYENSNGEILELRLLVNKDNYTKLQTANLIATQFKDAGIKITVDARSRENYFTALSDGDFHLYLGEVRFLPNMDLSCLVKKGGTAAYGITTPDKEESDGEDEAPAVFDDEYSYLTVLEGFYSGTNTAVDLASSLLASMPVIPVAYRSSIVFYSENIEEFSTASCYDLFFKSDEFKLK
jgi:ABC-type transport system substrate-binding protein